MVSDSADSQKTTREIVDLAKNKGHDALNVAVVQFFINAMDRKFRITTKDLEDISDDIVASIYESGKVNLESEMPLKEFINKLINKLFINNMLDEMHIKNWINFLKRVLNLSIIPDNAFMKGYAIMILALMLHPLSELLKTMTENSGDLEISNNMIKVVKKCLDGIMKEIPEGFKYKTLCFPIASEFFDVMEQYQAFFIVEKNNLRGYKTLLNTNNNTLIIKTLQSLTKLCKDTALQDQMVEFFLEDNDENDETVLDILDQLMDQKILQLEVVKLMKFVARLPEHHEMLTEQRRTHMFIKIFSSSKRLVKECVQLMTVLKVDFWPEVIRMLNLHVTEKVDLISFLTTLKSVEVIDCEPRDVLQIVLADLDKPPEAQRAAEIFIAMLNAYDTDITSFLGEFDQVLEKCLINEGTFCIMMRLFTSVSEVVMTKFFETKIHILKAIIQHLISGFEKFHDEMVLYNITSTLKHLYSNAPDYVIREIRKCFERYCVQIYKAREFTKELRTPFMKLSMLMEHRMWNILMLPECERIYNMNSRWITEEDDHAEMFPLLLRLHTNLIKHLWARMANNLPLPFDSNILSTDIYDFIKSLAKYVDDNSKEAVKNYYLALSSLLDLLVMFQPEMSILYEHEIFKSASFKVSKSMVRQLATLVKDSVFEANTEEDTENQRRMILQSWVSLCRNYRGMPSLTSSEKILRFYDMKSPFKKEMDYLMRLALEEEGNIFEQTLAFAIMNMANEKKTQEFRTFLHALDDFMRNNIEEKKRLTTMGSVCSYVLSKLHSHIESLKSDDGEEQLDRLDVLDFVAVVMKNMDPVMKQRLVDFIPDNLENHLDDVEKEHLRKFLDSLKAK